MYEAFYQLITNPFSLSPDPGFSFQHRTYRKAMTCMRHSLHREEGVILITGQPGTGKTTLINDLLRTLIPGQTVIAKLISTQVTADELFDLIAYSFNLDHEDGSKAKVLVQLERFLRKQYQHGRRSLLIVDEAQAMGEDVLEELYLLTNLQYKNHQLLQIFLVGPKQFLDAVVIPSLEQLHQRLIAATLLEPLDAENTEAYIKHRLHRAGWMGDPLISTETYAMIQQYSHGIPRRINQICNRLFLHGSIEEKHRLGTADLRPVIEGFQQELLMPMYKEGLTEAVSWPEEQFEETYKEEQKKVLCRHLCCYPQKPSARIVETRRHILVREPVSIVGPGIDDNQASAYHKKLQWHMTLLALFTALDSYVSKMRSLLRDRIGKTNISMVWGRAVSVFVLVTITLAAYFTDGDSDQPALELATMEALHPVSHPKIKLLRIHAATDFSAALGNELASDVFQQQGTLPSNVTQLETLPSPAAGKSNISASDGKDTDKLVDTTSPPLVAIKEITPTVSGVQAQKTIISNGPWFINIASLLHKANAERFMEDLESKGVAVGLYQVTVRGKDYWRVHVPGFASAAEANAKASLIKEKFGLKDTWVAKR